MRTLNEQAMPRVQKITPFLWFDNQAEEAATLYTSIFPNSRIKSVNRYGEGGKEHHRRPPGSVMLVTFELDGCPFQALNGGPLHKFDYAVSFVVNCSTQDDVDHYWEKLGEGGDPAARQCGWLKDRFGLPWQIIPDILPKLVGSPDSEKSQRAMAALMRMKKIDIAELQRAYEG